MRISVAPWALVALGVGCTCSPVQTAARAPAMSGMDTDILSAIGNTSLVRLRKVVPTGCADVHVKLESENPTGSLKDRMARAVISRAEEDGRLRPGDTVIEYTGGSTGTSLAFVCAAKGHRIRIVTSDALSAEKRFTWRHSARSSRSFPARAG